MQEACLPPPPEWAGLPWYSVSLAADWVAMKDEAIWQYQSQLGLVCDEGDVPPEKWGCVDPIGYMLSFARTNEVFRYVD
jgi:hypothetical protein